MALRILIYFFIVTTSCLGQASSLMEKDSIVNVDLWTHIARKQLPKYITAAEKDSLYTTEIKRTGKKELTVYLMYVGEAIDQKVIPCTFKKNKIVIDPIVEFKGTFFIWGRTSLKRKLKFKNLTEIEYHSKMKSIDFKYLIWPSKITKQKLEKKYTKLSFYGL